MNLRSHLIEVSTYTYSKFGSGPDASASERAQSFSFFPKTSALNRSDASGPLPNLLYMRSRYWAIGRTDLRNRESYTGCPEEGDVAESDTGLCFRWTIIFSLKQIKFNNHLNISLRYILNPATYDQAQEECASRGENLVSPNNVILAVEMFRDTNLGKARLDAVANDTCFRDGDGEKLDLDEIFGDGYSLQLPTAKSSDFVLGFEIIGNENEAEIMEKDELMTTVCEVQASKIMFFIFLFTVSFLINKALPVGLTFLRSS